MFLRAILLLLIANIFNSYRVYHTYRDLWNGNPAGSIYPPYINGTQGW